jgi:hypothetical protein
MEAIARPASWRRVQPTSTYGCQSSTQMKQLICSALIKKKFPDEPNLITKAAG